jgi:HPt (histidine-containing phosphotransfer) domain-containing protein
MKDKMGNSIKVSVSNADLLKENESMLIDKIIENKKKNRREIAEHFKRESNNHGSFINETFSMMLLQNLAVFTSFTNLMKSSGELLSIHLNEKLAKSLEIELKQLKQITEEFSKQSNLIEQIEQEQNIDMSEFRDTVNKEFLSFITGANLKLEENGIETGFKENIEVEFNDIKKNLSQIFKKEKDNETFMSVMSSAFKKSIGMGLTPDEKLKELVMSNFDKQNNKRDDKQNNKEDNSSKQKNRMEMKSTHKQK